MTLLDMAKAKTLRFRMIILFCSVVAGLLAVSYLAFWALLNSEVGAQLNRQLLETARPIIADLIAEPNVEDVNNLNIPDEFFELLNADGVVLQRSANLTSPIKFKSINPRVTEPTFDTGSLDDGRRVRLALIPFRVPTGPRVLAVAIRTSRFGSTLENFGSVALLIFPLSLLLTAGISTFYVGKSLAPITALTNHAALMAKRVTNREGFWTPLPVSPRHDELSLLAQTINQLLERVDSSVRPLRQFVTDASHELRTPLSVLHGETQLLLSKPRSAEEYRKSLCEFDEEFKKLTHIVEGLFTLSVADAGQLKLTKEPLYLDEVLEEACALVKSRADAKSIFLIREFNADVPYVGDEAFMRQLFLIFLDNAIKYSGSGTSIRVRLEKDDRVIRLHFEDKGIGISTKDLPFIFERFYRANASSNNGGPHQSGGLGLAIASAIVDVLGGSIECKSTPGVGSNFTVILPGNSLPVGVAV
ncbi:MAG TPA: HAMP domain-containing sensor histidine kinase [Candidatus Acidoferrum sp.]|nr:HAMP domain-containing sensor histidine kinase [Candidatus Acidoferrum sp.]